MVTFESDNDQCFPDLAEIILIPPGDNRKNFDETEVQAVVRFATQTITIDSIFRKRTVEIALLQAEIKLKLTSCQENLQAKPFSRALGKRTVAREQITNRGAETSFSSIGSGKAGIAGTIGAEASRNTADKSTYGSSEKQIEDTTQIAELVSAVPGLRWLIGTKNGDPRFPNGETQHLQGDDYLPQGDAVLCIVHPEKGCDNYEIRALLRAKVDSFVFFEKGKLVGPVEPNSTLAKKIVTLQNSGEFSFESGKAYVSLGEARLRATQFEAEDSKTGLLESGVHPNPNLQKSRETLRNLENAKDRSLENLACIAGKDPKDFWQGIDLAGLRYTQADVMACSLRPDQIKDAIMMTDAEMIEYSRQVSQFLRAYSRYEAKLQNESFENRNSHEAFKRALSGARSKYYKE